MARKRKQDVDKEAGSDDEKEEEKEEVEYPHDPLPQDPINFKPGQRYPTPSPGTGDRVFYESLFHQNPNSKMARDYCLLYGILPRSEASRLYDGTDPPLSQTRSAKEEDEVPNGKDKHVKKESKRKSKAKPRKRKKKNDDDEEEESSSSEEESSSDDDSS